MATTGTFADVIALSDGASAKFAKAVQTSEKKMLSEVVTMLKDLEITKAGNIASTSENLKKMMVIRTKLYKLANNKEYLAAVKDLIGSFDEIYKKQIGVLALKDKIGRGEEKYKLMKELAVENTVAALSGDGLAANVTNKLSEILLTGVTSGAKFSDLQGQLYEYLADTESSEGALTRYAKTWSVTALSQYSGQINKLATDDLDYAWYMYAGSTIETTREFCQHVTKKKYVHVSELGDLLKGRIEYEGEVHECGIYAKTGLPFGMIEGTTVDNLQINCGGWNCRHQLYPVADEAVPQALRDAIQKKLGDLIQEVDLGPYRERIEAVQEYLNTHKSGKVSKYLFDALEAAKNGDKDGLESNLANAEKTIQINEASIRSKAEKAKRMKLDRRAEATKRTAEAYIKEFKGLDWADTSALENAYKQGKWEDVRKEALKLALMKRDIFKKSVAAMTEAKDFGEIDTSKLQKYYKARDLAKMRAEAGDVEKLIAQTKAAEAALSDLIPNAHDLHKSYKLSELETAHKELEDVMKKWLAKYSYSSLENAPLLHLKNKLEFERTNPSVRYSNQDIVKKAIEEKMRLIDVQIEWNDLLTKVQSLKTFDTKVKAYKKALDKVEDALSSKDPEALRKAISAAEAEQIKIVEKQIKRGGDKKTALNKEYKGGAVGKDITASVDAKSMVSADRFGGTYTNNVARMQGYDAPAKLVSAAEFDMLAKACGDVFFRTVNPTDFNGKHMSSQEFAAQYYTADLMELNGPGGRVYGDGIYAATSAWSGSRLNAVSDSLRQHAYNSSVCYGYGNHTLLEMTWTRKPKIIKQTELLAMWRKLTPQQKMKYGGTDSDYANTYGCALGYDAMYCDGVNYMVIWNRSIIAVKKQ